MKNTKDVNNPEKRPNSLITKPEKYAPYTLYKLEGFLLDIKPQLGSSGLNEKKIKHIDINKKKSKIAKLLFIIFVNILSALTSSSDLIIEKPYYSERFNCKNKQILFIASSITSLLSTIEILKKPSPGLKPLTSFAIKLPGITLNENLFHNIFAAS